MTLKRKHTTDDSGRTTKRPFVGREKFIKLFKDTVKKKFSKKLSDTFKPTVIAFHGQAGIGKTELRKKLAEELENEYPAAIWGIVDFQDAKCRLIENALFRFRTELKSKPKIKFPAFDLAYAYYWKKANPNMALNKETFSLWGEAGLVTDVINVAGGIPLIGFIPSVGKLIGKYGEKVKDWWKTRGQVELQRFTLLESHEMPEKLPLFLAEDLSRHVSEFRLPLVLFFDTYEALWEKERDESNRFTKDLWIRTLVENLPQAVCVITGRKEIEWSERDNKWDKFIIQHEIKELSEKRSMEYLEGCRIEDEKIRKVIFDGSKGVPLYLALSAETFDNIKKEREPVPDDFGKTFPEIFERFIRNLKENEIETLKVLSAARKWDFKLFKLLVNEFGTQFPLTMINQFCKLPFVKHDADSISYSLHELMREHLQEYQDEDLRKRVHKYLFNFYNKQLKGITVKNITDKHKTALAEGFYHATNFMTADNLFKWIKTEAQVFDDAAQWQIQIPLYQQTMDLIEKTFGENDHRIATCLNDICEIYRNLGKYKTLEPLYKRVIKIYEISLGKNHEYVAIGLNNLALLYKFIGRYKEAEPLYNRALEISEKALGPEHPDVAIRLNNLAGPYYSTGRYDEAESLYKRALKISEKALGPEHPDVAIRLNNLAALYDSTGRYDEAEPLYKRALEISDKALGPDHPSVAIRLNNLAALYDSTSRYDKAEPLYKRALKIWEKNLGEDHPNVASALNNLAALYDSTGRYDKAEPLYKRAIKIDKKALGPEHPDFATDLNNLASLYDNMGREDEARKYKARAEEIRKQNQ